MDGPRTQTCVFCGQAISTDEPMAGRPPAAAHARCADAALADDRHWDAIASASGEEGQEQPAPGTAPSRGRSGCLAGLIGGVVVAVAWLARNLRRRGG